MVRIILLLWQRFYVNNNYLNVELLTSLTKQYLQSLTESRQSNIPACTYSLQVHYRPAGTPGGDPPPCPGPHLGSNNHHHAHHLPLPPQADGQSAAAPQRSLHVQEHVVSSGSLSSLQSRPDYRLVPLMPRASNTTEDRVPALNWIPDWWMRVALNAPALPTVALEQLKHK